MPVSKFSLGLVVGAVLIASAAADESAKQAKKPANGATDGRAAFEQLKKLASDWQFVTPKDEASKGRTILRYKVVGGGSAVVETVFPDSDMEMVSVYHRDGDDLVMTHYCCCGNQPRLKAQTGTDKGEIAGEIAFELTGGCNLNPAKDMHMHSFRVRPVDADHLHSECEIFANGKCTEKHTFDLVRKK
jgi:hypothetical protein